MAYEIDDVSACTCANLRKAARAVTQTYDLALQPSGLKATQFTLLATLSRRGTLPVSTLAEALVMDRTTLTRNLKPLITKGFVSAEPGDDRRTRMVMVTPQGEVALDSALLLWRNVQSTFVGALGLETWSVLLDRLQDSVSVSQDG